MARQRPLTAAQQAVLATLREAGLSVGTTFRAQDLFPGRDAVDTAHRRTLRTLRAAGLLGQGEPAWASNVYVVLPETYQALAADRGWSR